MYFEISKHDNFGFLDASFSQLKGQPKDSFDNIPESVFVSKTIMNF